jgi:hypothetical protein
LGAAAPGKRRIARVTATFGTFPYEEFKMIATAYRIVIVTVIFLMVILLPGQAAAHCDSMDGPVVTAAKLALKTGEVEPVLKWVRKADEPDVRVAFERALKVRKLNPEDSGPGTPCGRG